MLNNTTALVSCFARCFHSQNNSVKIFDDSVADKILTKEEYNQIAENMANGISFFNPNFTGDKKAAIRWIADNRLSPTVLGRSAFCERVLANEIRLGCKQYLIFASGYDTFAYRNKEKALKVFEIDKGDMIDDKIKRLDYGGICHNSAEYIKCDFTKENWTKNIFAGTYNPKAKSFGGLMGISYYLTFNEFKNMIDEISHIICRGSAIVFDYPTHDSGTSSKTTRLLAHGAGETMKCEYRYKDIENILEENNMLVFEHLNHKEMTKEFFSEYNNANQSRKMFAGNGVNYCLAVKQ